jgi:hypothetical protein
VLLRRYRYYGSRAKLTEKSKEVKDIRAALDEAAIVSINNKKRKLTYVNDNFVQNLTEKNY